MQGPYLKSTDIYYITGIHFATSYVSKLSVYTLSYDKHMEALIQTSCMFIYGHIYESYD